MNKEEIAFVSLEVKNQKVEVKWGYTIWRKENTNLRYILGFEMYFCANNEEVAEAKSRALTNVFFEHFLVHNKKKSLKSMALELRKKGFKITEMDMYKMGQLVKNIPTDARFKNVNYEMPSSGYIQSTDIVNQEMEMA